MLHPLDNPLIRLRIFAPIGIATTVMTRRKGACSYSDATLCGHIVLFLKLKAIVVRSDGEDVCNET